MTPDPRLIEDLRLLEPLRPLWYWLAATGVAVLLGAALILRRRRRRPRGAPSARAQRSAYQDALAALEALVGLLEPPQSRPYAIESSTIIRRFIEGRFGIRAPFQATEEFLAAASQSPALEPHHRQLLAHYLGQCDLLKFARTQAGRDELHRLHTAAVRFVKESTPAIAPGETPR